jgi:HAD superfamily hydrolase (TIGR01509 family)
MYSQPESLIFDFDGVLADTEPLHWMAWRELLLPHEIELSWEEYCRIGRGVTDGHMLTRLPQVISNPTLHSTLREQLRHRRDTIPSLCAQGSLIGEPTVKLLESLSSFRLGLVTSSSRSAVEPILQAAGVAKHFQATVYGDEVSQHKPHPAPYLRIREKLGVSTGLVFEDSDAGMESATAAGFNVFRVLAPADLPETVQKALGRS